MEQSTLIKSLEILLILEFTLNLDIPVHAVKMTISLHKTLCISLSQNLC